MSIQHPKIEVGMEVYVRSEMYEPPYTPWYDAYKGHKFRVLEIEEGHCHLECTTDPTVVPKGWLHDFDLKQV